MKKQKKITLTTGEYYIAVGLILIVAGLLNDPITSAGTGVVLSFIGIYLNRRKK